MTDNTLESRKRQPEDLNEQIPALKKAKPTLRIEPYRKPTTFLSLPRELRQAIIFEASRDIIVGDTGEWRKRAEQNWRSNHSFNWGDAYAHLLRDQVRVINGWGPSLRAVHVELAGDVDYVVGLMMVKARKFRSFVRAEGLYKSDDEDSDEDSD